MKGKNTILGFLKVWSWNCLTVALFSKKDVNMHPWVHWLTWLAFTFWFLPCWFTEQCPTDFTTDVTLLSSSYKVKFLHCIFCCVEGLGLTGFLEEEARWFSKFKLDRLWKMKRKVSCLGIDLSLIPESPAHHSPSPSTWETWTWAGLPLPPALSLWQRVLGWLVFIFKLWYSTVC